MSAPQLETPAFANSRENWPQGPVADFKGMGCQVPALYGDSLSARLFFGIIFRIKGNNGTCKVLR
jgi:hypothetical protein